ncbi:MAG: mechanosensitive ion channel family protein [Bauldia sp.]
MDVVGSFAEDVSTFAAVAWTWFLDLLPRLIGALLILVIGLLIARYFSRGVVRLADRTGRLDPTLRPILRAVIRYTIAIIVIVAALAQLGVQTASVLAAIGAAGLAIGLALQGTLQNIAAGIMILWLRPFRAGDSIQVGAISGAVEEIGLFNARLRTGDGLFQFVPNSELWSKPITNFTRNPTRQATVDFAVEYSASLTHAREVLLALAERHPRILKDPVPQVVTQSLSAMTIQIQLRVWARIGDFDAVRWDLIESGKAALDKAGLHSPLPHQVVHLVPARHEPRLRMTEEERPLSDDPNPQ